MPKKPRDPEFLKVVGRRLKMLLDSRNDAVADVALGIGHVGPSTLYAAMRGTSGLDVASVAKLASLRWPGRQVPNLHWLITGQGSIWLAAENEGPATRGQDEQAHLVSLMTALLHELEPTKRRR